MISDAPLLGRRWLGGLIIDYSRAAVLFGVEVLECVFKNSVPQKRHVSQLRVTTVTRSRSHNHFTPRQTLRLSAAKKSYMREDVESTVRYVSTYTRRNGPPERFRKTKVLRKSNRHM